MQLSIFCILWSIEMLSLLLQLNNFFIIKVLVSLIFSVMLGSEYSFLKEVLLFMNVTIPCKVLTCLAQLFIMLFAGMLCVILMDKDRPAHVCSDYWNVLLKWKTTGINLFNPTWANLVNNCASKISYYYNCQSKKVCIKMDVKLFIMHPLCGSKNIHTTRLLDAVREKHSYISHATLHFICVCPRTFFQQFLRDLRAKGICLSVVEFHRKYMKLTKFVCDFTVWGVCIRNLLIRYSTENIRNSQNLAS